MKKISEEFSELNIRKLTIQILLVFVIGTCAVLAIAYHANKQINKHAEINQLLGDILDDCGKQRLISQYLSKNALLLNDSDFLTNQQSLERIDSTLSEFQNSNNRIRLVNKRLKEVDAVPSDTDKILSQLEPSLSALIRSSYGIQETGGSNVFRANILKYEEVFLPLMNELTAVYRSATLLNNDRLSKTITMQYWFIGGSVLLAASLVFLFSYRLLKVKISNQNRKFKESIELSKRYENLIQGTHDIVYEQDGDGKYIYSNDALEKLTGYTLEDLNKNPWYTYIAEDYRKEVIDFYRNTVKNKQVSSSYEFPIITASGEKRWISQSADFKYSDDGRMLGSYNVAKDITERKLALEKEDKYKVGLKLLNELNSRSGSNVEQRLEEGLKLCLDFLRLDVGIISQIWMDEYKVISFYPDDCGLEVDQKFKLGNTYCDITLAKKGKVLMIDEMSNSAHKTHPCFKSFKLESYIGSAYRVDGKVAGTVNFTSSEARKESFTDYEIDFISLVGRWVGSLMEMRKNRQRLLDEQNLLKTFVSSAPAAIAMLDKHMNYISASRRWYTDQNIRDDIIGKSHYKVFPEIPKKWKDMHQRALGGEIIKPGIEKFKRQDGSVLWLQGEIHPWYTTKDKVGGIIIFTNDLTELKRQEAELLKAKEEAENAGRIKEQFLSTMSHEIRTPLNAIIGTTNLLELEHPELSDSNRLKMLKFGSNNLLSLINDILDFQKIESGHLEIIQSDVNLRELSENIVETWRTVPHSVNVDLVLNYSTDLNDFYVCDSVRLTQILNNLISNAIKFTEKGSVELEVSPFEGGMVRFSVHDTGIGISEDKLETIFETFKQIHNQQTLKAGGTGLGLSISKKLVHMMGGTLEVTSTVGVGTNFHFSVPMGFSDGQSIAQKPVVADKERLNLVVLLAEDNLANQEIARAFLVRWGVRVDIANNGKEAVEMISKKPYDLVLMDVRMPVLDGYEATRQIREKKETYFKNVPIIALTASTLTESRAKMEESGMTDAISKPFDPQDLFDKIISYSRAESESHSVLSTNDGDFKFLNEVLAGDQEKIHQIVEMTVASISEGVQQVKEAGEKSDAKKAHDALHKMKSNLAHLDLTNLSNEIPDYKAKDFWENLPAFLANVELGMSEVKSRLK